MLAINDVNGILKNQKQHNEFCRLQSIAKLVLSNIGRTITPDDTERTIADRATSMMLDHGISETWYYQCPALVLLGSRSLVSVSGRDYVPAEEQVGSHNLVTIDLSPSSEKSLGDCARSFVIENSHYVRNPVSEEFVSGFRAVQSLHRTMLRFVTNTTSFEELFEFGNSEIARLGYKNLDFANNLGHSLVTDLNSRIYIEAGNLSSLDSTDYFTFEPHISITGKQWGFKNEEVYYFDATGRLQQL